MLLAIAVGTAVSCTPSSDADPAPARPMSAVKPARTFSDAAYAKHIAALRTRLASKQLGHLAIRIEDPFVVIGDGSEEDLAGSAQTVRWAADRLEQAFFTHRPTQILDVFLFTRAASYEHGVRALTGSSPTTPYGFYSRHHRGLFMNIATGGGTLVHEIVHPYVEADFPEAPPWLNEGLGSLFEQSSERGGHIIGLTNWRLAGLQETIAEGAVPSFEQLTALDVDAFYGRGSGTHYAAARYLLYYLQEKGLLRDFYREFRAARAKDPTGYATLAKILGERDMPAFQARWQTYVTKLRFP